MQTDFIRQSRFSTATSRNLKELASKLGPLEVGYISQDDKARVSIGNTAANKQNALLIYVDYQVTLPDHDSERTQTNFVCLC